MIFVQGEDGLFYINPIIEGKNWFLQCTDDGCEVHIKAYSSTNSNSAKRRALKVLNEAGVSVKIGEYIGENQTIFSGATQLVQAVGYGVTIRKAIPKPTRYDEVVNSPALEHPFIAWKLEFSREQIESIFDDTKRMNHLLVKFLTGKVLVKDGDRKLLQRLLKKLVPDPLPERVTIEI